MTPIRIQLSRKKGWRMPKNTVKVSRPGKWGNPFPVGKEGPMGRVALDNESAVGLFTDMLRDKQMLLLSGYPQTFHELRGKNLACWCGPGPCHADVLLRLANHTEPGDGAA